MKLQFNKEQVQILTKIGFPFDFLDDLTDDEILFIDEKVMDYFEEYCILDGGNDVSKEGQICESIIDLIADSE
jgi:hypothetical protein